MLEYEYVEALAEIVCAKELSDKVRTLRLNGVGRFKDLLQHYANEGFAQRIVIEVWRQKITFILNANTKTVMEEVINPSAPHYNGNEFVPRSQYHSEAEELILWSMTSLKGPLISAGAKRYSALFAKYFPKEVMSI
jgi:hypothetical protein